VANSFPVARFVELLCWVQGVRTERAHRLRRLTRVLRRSPRFAQVTQILPKLRRLRIWTGPSRIISTIECCLPRALRPRLARTTSPTISSPCCPGRACTSHSPMCTSMCRVRAISPRPRGRLRSPGPTPKGSRPGRRFAIVGNKQPDGAWKVAADTSANEG